jgi:hypothetical protein
MYTKRMPPRTERGSVGGIVVLVLVVLLVFLALLRPHLTGAYLQRMGHDIADMLEITWRYLTHLFGLAR